MFLPATWKAQEQELELFLGIRLCELAHWRVPTTDQLLNKLTVSDDVKRLLLPLR